MPKGARHKAFLVTVLVRHQPRRTYAIVKETPEEALAAVRALSTEQSRLYLVGGLSRNLVRHLKMKPDDLRLMDSGSRVARPASASAELPPTLLAEPNGN